MRTEREEAAETLLAALRTVRENGPHDINMGICAAVVAADEDCDTFQVDDLLEELFTRWPEYSGILPYPVPGGYTAYMTAASCWDRDTEYGRLRWELLDFCIEELEKEQAK